MMMRFFAAAAVLMAGCLSGLAQDEGNTPPTITGITWFRAANLDGNPDPLSGIFTAFEPFDPVTELATEFDLLAALVDVSDPDFTGEGGEGVFMAFNAIWVPLPGYLSPEAPPVAQSTAEFVPDGEGFSPNPGQTTLTIQWVMQVPGFIGKNQARLRGLINWDVRYNVVFAAANEVPDEEFYMPGVTVPGLNCNGLLVEAATWLRCESIQVVENPAAAPPNPQAFADAGPDRTVEAGDTVLLDGSRTFDSFNIGFNPNSPNVFEKDELQYTWEWISGPERVDPITRDLDKEPAIAEVTLNELGTYVYRLTVDDGVNPLPTTDSVVITVVALIPDNRAPVAEARGPAGAVVRGSLITLDGTRSFDPDGDPLSFLWQQTDEIGGQIPPEDFGRFFQPVSGLESPVSRWQAIKTGTFHFRLLVSDGEFVGTDRISIEVIDAPTAGVTAVNGFIVPSRDDDESAATADQSTGGDEGQPSAQPVPACGTGMLPVLLVPLGLMFMRVRRRI